MADTQSTTRRPLLITGDSARLDDVLRLAAAADVEMDVAHVPSHARRSWSSAPVVLVGRDLAAEVSAGRPPRRDGVLLLGEDRDDPEVWQQAVALGVEEVIFPDDESWLVDRLADAVEEAPVRADTICVLGGRGGAGASTLAAALAATGIRNGMRTLLVDGDPFGGGIDLVLGSEQSTGSRWSDFVETRGRVSGAALRSALPCVDELVVLSCDRGSEQAIPVEAMRSVLAAARRSSELVVIDLPRCLGSWAEEALACADAALLVVPAEVRATVAAVGVAGAAARLVNDLRVVVRGPAPSGLSSEVVAGSVGLPLAGNIREENGLAMAVERGDGPLRNPHGPLAQFCSSYLAYLRGAVRTEAA